MPSKSSSVSKSASPKRSKALPGHGVRRRRADSALTKRDLVMAIALEAELPQEVVHGILQRTLDRITEALADGRHVEFRDFGVFELARRRSRVGRNPNRPERTVTIPERKVVKFKPGKRMKELIAKA